MSPVEVLASVVAVAATAFVALAVAGLVRFGDILSRVHAATKAMALGVLLALAVAAFRLENVGDVVKVVLAGALLFVSSPVSTHMMSRAAYRAGAAPDDLAADDLAGTDPDEF